MSVATLTRRGTWCSVETTDRDHAYNVLRPVTSYAVEGAEYSDAYIAGVWDGRKCLVKRVKNAGLAYPPGLHGVVESTLKRRGFAVEVVDDRPKLPVPFKWEWTGHPLRPYQEEAVEAALTAAEEGGGGILKMPIRSGKTLTAARIVHHYGARALFLVPSDLLLQQSLDAFRAFLGGARVTGYSGEEKDLTGDVVVASIQAMTGAYGTRAFRPFETSFPIVVVDEFHHVGNTGDAWRDALLAVQARYRFGLSATVRTKDGSKNDPESVWLLGACGPVVHEVMVSGLIEAGYLVRPDIVLVDHGAPAIKLPAKANHQKVYGQGISDCVERNAAIVERALSYDAPSNRVLVDVGRISHARTLVKMLKERGGPNAAGLLIGSMKRHEREKVLDAFRAGKVKVVVSTVLGEGVDIPQIDVVINGEGGRGYVPTIQRMRNLTPYSGKESAVVVDMVDMHHPRLREWTLERIRVYEEEPAFRLRVA